MPDEITLRYPLVGFAVSSGDLAEPYNRQITLGWFSAVISAIAFVVTARAVNMMWIWNGIKSAWSHLNDVSQLVIGAIASIALLFAMFITWQAGVPTIFRRDSVQLGLAMITAGLVYINPMLIITLIAIMVLFIFIYHRLELGVILAVFWSPFFLFPVELYRFSFPMAEVITLITLGAMIFRGLVTYASDGQILPQYMRKWSWKWANA